MEYPTLCFGSTSGHSTRNSSMESFEENPICVGLDLDLYKSSPCPRKQIRDCPKSCAFFHSDNDSRRPFSSFHYLATRCPKNCRRNDCHFSNNIIEEKYHPSLYKKKYCRKLLETGNCDYRESCPFAHSDQELRLRPLHLLPIDADFMLFSFKSQFCPYSWQRHNAFTCVYAHNWQDFKRPYFKDQVPQLCPAWKDTSHVEDYAQNCPDGFSCKFCHGWKELDFHPDNLKSERCTKPEHQQVSFGQIQTGKASKSSKKSEQLLSKHTCCFKHTDEAKRSAPGDHFLLAKKQTHFQSFTTNEYLQELGLFPKKKSFSAPSTPPSFHAVVDFLVFQQEVASTKPHFASHTSPLLSTNSFAKVNGICF